ncbi:MAG: RluA family pseudouridine synthase [Actinomycetia bacterium]|nr:RluA family pseudouridine synthase [Actinomycetes bacterium]
MPLRFEVTAQEAGRRLDRLLADRDGRFSRTAWQRAVAGGRVTVDGRPVTAEAFLVRAGQIVEAEPPEEAGPPVALTHEPVPVPVPIRFQDAHLLVVAKPRGLVVHPAAGHWHHTLVQALWPAIRGDAGDPLRPGVVHRLDKDTTGLMLVARSAEVRRRLSEALAARRIERRYWAVVHGVPRWPAGRVEAPLGRHPRARQRMAVVPDGRPAATLYTVLARWDQYSWLELGLETGRTHQIRVHLAHLGHPVVGDPAYGRPDLMTPVGQALHAFCLTFTHPVTGVRITCLEPWPADWEPLLGRLGPPREGAVPEAGITGVATAEAEP